MSQKKSFTIIFSSRCNYNSIKHQPVSKNTGNILSIMSVSFSSKVGYLSIWVCQASNQMMMPKTGLTLKGGNEI